MRVVSLFSGAGGLDLGFIRAGHKVVWANDDYNDAVATYRRNIGDHIVPGDVRKVRSRDIPDADIVAGGFPCQGFSVANTGRHAADSRNSLYLEMLRIIKAKKPKYLLAENVKGLLSLENGRVIEMIVDDFRKSGYRVKHEVLNAADYGVPQTRLRVFILGTRKDIKREIGFPLPTHSKSGNGSPAKLKPWVTIGKALADIPEPEDAPDIPNHTYSKYKLLFNGYLGHRRVNPERPAPTVTARGDLKGGVVVLHHPGNHRRMSARELAATQSFPKDFVFCGPRSSVYRQVANAVPPLLAEAIAKEFRSKRE